MRLRDPTGGSATSWAVQRLEAKNTLNPGALPPKHSTLPVVRGSRVPQQQRERLVATVPLQPKAEDNSKRRPEIRSASANFRRPATCASSVEGCFNSSLAQANWQSSRRPSFFPPTLYRQEPMVSIQSPPTEEAQQSSCRGRVRLGTVTARSAKARGGRRLRARTHGNLCIACGRRVHTTARAVCR